MWTKVRLSPCKLNLSSFTFSLEVLLGTVQESSSARVTEQSSEEIPWWRQVWWGGRTRMFWWRTSGGPYLRWSDGLGLPQIVSCHCRASNCHPSYHQSVSLTVDVRSQAGVGKSSLINHVFRAKEAVWGYGQRCVRPS